MNGLIESDSQSAPQDDAAVVADLLLKVAENPQDIQPLVQLGTLFARGGRLTEARVVFHRVLAVDEKNLDALWALSDLEQVLGNTNAALQAQCRAIALQPVINVATAVRRGPARQRPISVLVLCIPGTFQANTPLEFIANSANVVIHKWYLSGSAHPELPEYDVIFTAIGHDPTISEILVEAQAFIDAQSRPVINEPRLLPYLSRDLLAERFSGSPCVSIAPTERLTHAQLAAREITSRLLVRPTSSQAGDRFALLRNNEERDRYLELATPTDELYTMPFIDYRSEDGYYRKYRVAFIDSEAYPVHLAISPRWMVHYYNSSMSEFVWMRREEEAFLNDISSVFSGERGKALREIAEALPFGYFAIDCGIAPDGRVMLFEADTAMLIHLEDSEELFPYKKRYMELIVNAVDTMFARRAEHANLPASLPLIAYDSDLELEAPMHVSHAHLSPDTTLSLTR
jgi:hypothetical protein